MEKEEGEDPALSILAKITWPIIGSIVLCENIFFIFLVCKCHKLHTSKYFFAASLGITDILVGATYSFGSIFYIPAPGIHYEEGSMVTVFSLSTGATIMSIIHMAMIALDRYLYIAHPFFYEKHLTDKAIRGIIACFWCIGLLIVSGLVIIEWLMLTGDIQISRERKFRLLTFFYVGVYVIFTTITCICYALILHQVKKHKRALITLGAAVNVQRRNDYAKSLKFFMVVFGGYFVMTCPFFVSGFLSVTIDLKGMNLMQDILKCLLILNSATNFVILATIDRNFRKSIESKLCHCLTRLRQSISQSNTTSEIF